MEEIIRNYFDEHNHIRVKDVVQEMMQRPWEAEETLEKVIKTAWFLMKKEALEHKFKHKMRELHEEYDMDFSN